MCSRLRGEGGWLFGKKEVEWIHVEVWPDGRRLTDEGCGRSNRKGLVYGIKRVLHSRISLFSW